MADTLAGIIERARTSDRLVLAHEQNSRLLSSLTSILIGVDDHDCIRHWNDQAVKTFGLPVEQVIGEKISQVPIAWDWSQMSNNIRSCIDKDAQKDRFEARFKPEGDSNRLLSVCATPFIGDNDETSGYLLIADDVTEQKQIESEMQQLQKLQSIGQLAAGIAHEINTPIQYVGDNVRFLRDAFQDISEVVSKEQEVANKSREGKVPTTILDELDELVDEMDLEYLQEEVPKSIQQTLDGVDRVATIVRAMKEFSHPGSDEKTLTDINKAVNSTATVTRNVWKYHAELQLDLDPALPQVRCVPGPINEVILNIIVNASHAIAERVGDSGELGRILITTGQDENWVILRISDTGTGIPEKARDHVFDPFFTTKDVGQGTGQGLSLSHKIIVDQHGGELGFKTEMDVGTTFIIKLPLREENN